MLKIFTKAVLVLWHLKFGLGLETYYMLDYCGEEIDMVSQDVYTGRLSIDGAFAGDCNATIETWYSADKLMFYFENLNFPENVDGCNVNYIQVYDKNMMGDYQLMHGLHKVCGSHTPSRIFVPRGRYVKFRYVSNGTTTNKMNVVFTAFHTGNCRSYEYRCSNGRCIDDGVNCNGFNPCGDYSDCRLSAAAIAGIVIGSVFAICVVATLAYVCVKNKRGPPKVRTVQAGASPTSALGSSLPSYGTSSSTSGYSRLVTPVNAYQIHA